MIIVWGSIETTAENMPGILDLSLEHVRRSRTEPGCISHSAQVDAEDENRVVFFEEWQDMALLQAHFEVPESKVFVDAVSKLAASPPVIKIFEATQLN